MMIDMHKRIAESIGYKNMIKGLDFIFRDDYKIVTLIPDDDETSYDFSTIINVENVNGIDIGVSNSGNSHQFQIGVGTIDIAVPVESGFFKLPSGKYGESLSRVIKDESIKFGASADNPEQIKEYFLKLKNYLENK